MLTAGLSLDQAPPVSVPMRFFVTAPVFGAAAGLMAAWSPDIGASRWQPALIAAAHLLLLGVVVMVMMGATQQMLPVLAGARIKGARLVSGVVHVAWTTGAAGFAAGMAGGPRIFLAVGLCGLVVGASVFLTAALAAMSRAKARTGTVSAMRLALGFFAAVVGLGAWLLLGHLGWVPLLRGSLTDAHLLLGLGGWIGLLIIGVSFQVVPMFQLTAPFPAILRRWLCPTLALAVFLHAAGGIAAAAGVAVTGTAFRAVSAGATALLGTGWLMFAGTVLRLQQARRRRITDAGLWLWRLGMAGVTVSVLVFWAAESPWVGDGGHWRMVALATFVSAFVLPVLVAMVMKITPFLVWFHLQSLVTARMLRGEAAPKLPNMREVLPERQARFQLWLCVAVAALLPSGMAMGGLMVTAAGLTLAAQNFHLMFLLIRSFQTYRTGVGQLS